MSNAQQPQPQDLSSSSLSNPSLAVAAVAALSAAATPASIDIRLAEQESLILPSMREDTEARRRAPRSQQDIMLTLVDRLAPRQPTPEEIARMSRGRLFFTQCAALLIALLLFLAFFSYSFARLSTSEVAQTVLSSLNSSFNRFIEESHHPLPADMLPLPPGTSTSSSDYDDDDDDNPSTEKQIPPSV